MAILVTGGAGYIGSHCMRILRDRGIGAVTVDNLAKGHIQAVAGEKLYVGSISDGVLLDRIFTENKIDAVIHFAAFSLVGESVRQPYEYYNNNVCGTLSLLHSMTAHGVGRIVFSSTAATYGVPEKSPVTEDMPQSPINTYGDTKLAIEHMIRRFGIAYGLKAAFLRYFNVAGAYHTGEIGEDHRPETHLIPNVLAVALGKSEQLTIFGDDYKTPDGTCVRDYVDVEDLIDAHILALDYLNSREAGAAEPFNLGSGGGYSNMQILQAARGVTGHAIPAQIGERRAGDPDVLVASSEKAERILGWKRRHGAIEDIIGSAWKWHSAHPNGYGD